MPTARSFDPHGATPVRHDGHVDFLSHGRLLHPVGDHIEEHVLAVSLTNPDRCDAEHRAAVEPGHVHGPDCGHEMIPHGDHIDFLVEGRLQHPHGDHVDDHGPLPLA